MPAETAVCVAALPAGESRTIKTLGVFLVTASFSVFAYLWLLLIVAVFTPDVITVPEGVLTIVFLILLIVTPCIPFLMLSSACSFSFISLGSQPMPSFLDFNFIPGEALLMELTVEVFFAYVWRVLCARNLTCR